MSQIICPHCQNSNRIGARFCARCGSQIMNGKYAVSHELGRGGMGAVHLAYQTIANTQRTVVIKEMLDYFDPNDLQEATRAQARFEAEAAALVTLSAAGIPHIYDYFSENGRNYIVMEYIEGQNLEGGGPYAADLVRGWGIQVCRVLEYLTVRNVVHMDIKPANLILDSSGNIWLVDFGTAKAQRTVQPGGRVGMQKSSVYGTEGYAPPEQYAGRGEPRSDVYALGATLYHLLTGDDPGQHPFQFPQLGRLPADLRVLLEKALEQEVNRRATAVQLRGLLEAQPTARTKLSLSAQQIDFGSVAYGQTPARQFHLHNAGGGAFTAHVFSHEHWLQVSPASVLLTGQQQTVTVQATTASIGQQGQQSGVVHVDAGAAGQEQVQVSLRLAGPVTLSPGVGGQVGNVNQLLAWCDEHRQAAVQLLRKGELHAMARYLGKPTGRFFLWRDDSAWTASLAEVQQANTIRDDNVALETALRALGAQPPKYDHNWGEVESSLGMGFMPDPRWFLPGWKGPTRVVFRIQNRGPRGYLHGRLESLVPWLTVANPEFGCLPGDTAEVEIMVDKRKRKLGGVVPEIFNLTVR